MYLSFAWNSGAPSSHHGQGKKGENKQAQGEAGADGQTSEAEKKDEGEKSEGEKSEKKKKDGGRCIFVLPADWLWLCGVSFCIHFS